MSVAYQEQDTINRIQDAINEVMEEYSLKCIRQDNAYRLVKRHQTKKYPKFIVLDEEIFGGLLDGEYKRKPKR